MRRFSLIVLFLSLVGKFMVITSADAANDHSTTTSSLPSSTRSMSSPIATSTPSPTSTSTPTPSPTRTPSPTPSPTKTPSPTPSPTRTPSPTPSPTKAPSPTPGPTKTPSSTSATSSLPLPASTAAVSTIPRKTVTPSVVVTQSTPQGSVPTSVPTIEPTNLPGSTSQSTTQLSQGNGFPLMTVIVSFLSGLGIELLLYLGWWSLRKLLLPMLGVKLPPGGVSQRSRVQSQLPRISPGQKQPGFVTQQVGSPYASGQGRRGKTLTIFKLFITVGSFLLVGTVASFFLLSYPIYLVVTWVVLTILFSNILNQQLRAYYRIGFEQVLTTLHSTRMKMAQLNLPLITQRTPHLRSITDTTAYLNVLRQNFKLARKKETGRNEQHQ